jgi:hypothetical protein
VFSLSLSHISITVCVCARYLRQAVVPVDVKVLCLMAATLSTVETGVFATLNNISLNVVSFGLFHVCLYLTLLFSLHSGELWSFLVFVSVCVFLLLLLSLCLYSARTTSLLF